LTSRSEEWAHGDGASFDSSFATLALQHVEHGVSAITLYSLSLVQNRYTILGMLLLVQFRIQCGTSIYSGKGICTIAMIVTYIRAQIMCKRLTGTMSRNSKVGNGNGNGNGDGVEAGQVNSEIGWC